MHHKTQAVQGKHTIQYILSESAIFSITCHVREADLSIVPALQQLSDCISGQFLGVVSSSTPLINHDLLQVNHLCNHTVC